MGSTYFSSFIFRHCGLQYYYESITYHFTKSSSRVTTSLSLFKGPFPDLAFPPHSGNLPTKGQFSCSVCIFFGVLDIPLTCFLYLAYKWDHSVSVPFPLTHFTQYGKLQLHPNISKLHNFILQPSNIPLCVCPIVSLSSHLLLDTSVISQILVIVNSTAMTYRRCRSLYALCVFGASRHIPIIN